MLQVIGLAGLGRGGRGAYAAGGEGGGPGGGEGGAGAVTPSRALSREPRRLDPLSGATAEIHAAP